MKKLFIILFAVMAFGFIGSQAQACWWDGYWGGPMGGSWGGYYSNVNPGGSQQKFLNDTAKLRGELAAKQGEYNALMAQTSPDPKRAGTLSQEIAELNDQLKAKAQAYDLPAPGYRGNYHRPHAGHYNDYCSWGGRACW